jgi:AraC family transcriptional regulator
MLPNTSLATMPLAVRPANNSAPRIEPASVRLRRLHSRTWTGVSAELFEMRAADRGLVELPSDTMRLLIMLNEVGGRSALRTSARQETRSDYLGPNHISLLPDGVRVWHCVERMGYCRYLLIHFDADRLVSGKAKHLQFEPRLMFSDSTIWRYGQLIAQECARPGMLSDAYGESLSLTLFLFLARLNDNAAREPNQSRLAHWQLRKVTDFIRAHLAETLELSELAAISGLSSSHFGRAFKGSTGLPPHRWQLNLRVEQACAMLADATASLADVACAMGFADQSHFTRVFSRIVGITPGAWRRARAAEPTLPKIHLRRSANSRSEMTREE